MIPKEIKTEMKTVDSMIRLACSHFHNAKSLCIECRELSQYAMFRLEHCRFGADKPACNQCPTHCYKTDMKERIRDVMRYAGPKMLFHHPWLALIHLWKELRPSASACRPQQ